MKSRVSGVSTPVDIESPVSDDEDQGLEFDENEEEDDSGSEFEADEDEEERPEPSNVEVSRSTKANKSRPRTRKRAKSMDSENIDEEDQDELDEEANASEDEALMMEAAIHASLAPKDEDENGAGPSSSRPTAKNSRTKAAALRAAAAERRLGIKKDSDAEDFVLDDGDESFDSSDGSDEESAGKSKKGKGGDEEKKTGTMTLSELKAERRAAREASKKEMAPIHAAVRKKVKELKRKLTHVRTLLIHLGLVY